MISPHNYPNIGPHAGGCFCDYCGIIFIGADWHDGCCAVCARDTDGNPQGGNGEAGSVRSMTAGAEGIAQPQSGASS